MSISDDAHDPSVGEDADTSQLRWGEAVADPRRTTMAKPSKSEYIQWVKGSLNRLLGASLSDDGKALLEDRSWLITFQMKHTE